MGEAEEEPATALFVRVPGREGKKRHKTLRKGNLASCSVLIERKTYGQSRVPSPQECGALQIPESDISIKRVSPFKRRGGEGGGGWGRAIDQLSVSPEKKKKGKVGKVRFEAPKKGTGMRENGIRAPRFSGREGEKKKKCGLDGHWKKGRGEEETGASAHKIRPRAGRRIDHPKRGGLKGKRDRRIRAAEKEKEGETKSVSNEEAKEHNRIARKRGGRKGGPASSISSRGKRKTPNPRRRTGDWREGSSVFPSRLCS